MTHVPRLSTMHLQIHIDLYLPAGKRFKRSLDLFGSIDPGTSSFRVLGTKVRWRFLYLKVLVALAFVFSSTLLLPSPNQTSELCRNYIFERRTYAFFSLSG